MKGLLKISEFAALSGISRQLLIFYDNHGILHPAVTDPENGYRYYSYRQIDTANVIVAFRGAGMSLERIREYLTARSPQNLMQILEMQEQELERQIQKLEKIKAMVSVRMAQTERGISTRAGSVAIKEYPQENLFLGPELPKDYQLADGWNYLPQFYAACAEENIQLGFPVGTLVTQEKLEERAWNQPAHYYYRLPKGQYPDFFQRPGGLYVEGTQLTDYGHTDTLYQQILSYIEEHGLQICGNAYEEFLIDEISESNPDAYLLQISVQV